MATSGHAEAVAVRAWARGLVESNDHLTPLDLVAEVTATVAGAMGGRDLNDRFGVGDPPLMSWPDQEPPGGRSNVWLPGVVHEQAVSAEDRTARGAWYTPQSVVRGLVALATAEGVVPVFAADPTCGGGSFLLAVLDRLVELGLSPAEAVGRVGGLDIDTGAAQVSRWSITLWAEARGVTVAERDIDVTVGDALAGYPAHWPADALLIGNPPFATPLRTGAVPAEVQAFRAGREHLLGPYTDLAALHLLGAVEKSAPGATIALVQPQSVLSGRDTAALRDHCDAEAPVSGLWAAREPVFDAGVRACALVLRRGPAASASATVALASGPEVEAVGEEPFRPASWASYAARALGAPALPATMIAPSVTDTDDRTGRLGSLVSATAGFRDEYYGLVEACGEWEGLPGTEPNRLVTVGAVEPLATKWGIERCRFGRRPWLRPWIDTARLDVLDDKVSAWTQRQLQPKVILATQSRILEPVIDRRGRLVPATPLIAVHAEPEDLSLVAAVLLAPPVVAWAWQRWFGAALAVDALKLAARQVLELPLPADREAWREAADLISDAPISSIEDGWAVSCRVASIMTVAYGADGAVLQWWLDRSGDRTLPDQPAESSGTLDIRSVVDDHAV